jgi:hypothetical protein
MALTLISTHTASASATLDITSGIDSTYDSYEFHFVNMHPQTQHVNLQFQVNASDDTGGGFDTSVITSTYFLADHDEGDTEARVIYNGGYDQAQGAAYQSLFHNLDNEADDSCSGILTLYDPSSTTYVKHFTSTVQGNHHTSAYSMVAYAAGYINQTLAIPEISFKMSSGNIDAGTIKMFGVS